jgi:hypothetical protein
VVAAIVLASTLSGCERWKVSINQGFDYSGEQSQRSENGVLDKAIREIEIENMYGDVVVEKSDAGTWQWDLKCWAKTKELADEYCQAIELRQYTSGVTHSWQLKLPDQYSELRGVKSAWGKVKFENTCARRHQSFNRQQTRRFECQWRPVNGSGG